MRSGISQKKCCISHKNPLHKFREDNPFIFKAVVGPEGLEPPTKAVLSDAIDIKGLDHGGRG